MKALLAILTAALAIAQTPVSPGPRRDTPGETGKASIEGVVVDALTHTPIRKASVSLSGRTYLQAVTGADGRFAFRELPAGSYVIQAQSERYPRAPFSFDLENQASVSLTADEQKTDIALSLAPGASLRGRLVDDEGSPMQNCSVTPTRLRSTETGRAFTDANGSSTDEKGEYRIDNIPPGKYYVVARCLQSIPMPHAFVRRDARAAVPTLTYPPVFYPASPDLSAATRVTLAPGTELSGIDFRMAAAAGVPVRGRVQPIPSDPVQIMLRPKDTLLGRWQPQGAPVNRTTGEFQMPSVRPGSYELVATVRGGNAYTASAPIEVGAIAPEPVDLHLTPVPQLTGSVSIEGDVALPLKNLQIFLFPVDGQPLASQVRAEVQSDGTFTIAPPPGRWRLRLNSAPGYIKSVAIGDQQVEGATIEIGPTPGPLKIVIGTKNAQLDCSLAAAAPNSNPIAAILWANDSDVRPTLPLANQGPATFSVPPGTYHACAIQGVQPFAVLQDDTVRKGLESSCPTVELPEGSHKAVSIPLVPADELKRIIDRLETDPAF